MGRDPGRERRMEGGGEVALVSPKFGKTGCGRGPGRCLGGTWFGSFAELVLPGCQELLVRS